jgi:hypothetical protein
MDTIVLTFANPINISVQIGDMIYYQPPGGSVTQIGPCTAIASGRLSLDCKIATDDARPASTDFILFSKDNKANIQQLTGYYAEVKMENNRDSFAELFSMGSEIYESSK